ncbi:Uma2 family endonuclease [Actinoplanes sp. URMC 104]|uniref:Uma2 family endonuclease n=1 Tax=Actinoplanes sp. URMC 104 TaxID=3423409 RepID=UPI003F1CF669
MTSTALADNQPMSGEEFLALGDTSPRVELFDGSLHVTPAPTIRHQRIGRRLANALETSANAAGLQVDDAVNVRLLPERILIPDVVVFSAEVSIDQLVIDGSAVHLVCEILSPSDPTTDKVLKMHYYAAAGIPKYLVVDPVARTFQLHELQGTAYTEHWTIRVGDVLRLTEPLVVDLEPAVLLPE